MDFVRGGQTFDTVQLGGMTSFVEEEHFDGELLLSQLYTPHAYIISREGMRKFLEYLPESYASSTFSRVPHDVITSIVWDKTYCPRDNYIVDQRWNDSDNEWFPDATRGEKKKADWVQLRLVPSAIKVLESFNRALTFLPVDLRPKFVWPCTLVAHDARTGALTPYQGGALARATFAATLFWCSLVKTPPPPGVSTRDVLLSIWDTAASVENQALIVKEECNRIARVI